MSNELEVPSVEEIHTAARNILQCCGGKKIFAFFGEMGSGKTTLIQALCKELGIREKVVSPTFSLVNEYKGAVSVYHLDLYRLSQLQEAVAIGIDEYLTSGNYCFIEWPELINELLPAESVQIQLEVTGQSSRRIKITGCKHGNKD